MPARTLLKALTEAGAGSRRRMAEAIMQGMVTVNGRIAEDLKLPIDPEGDEVCINGRPVSLKPNEIICLMLNKPEGILSTTSDERGRRTVTDILPEAYRKLRLYPAGRLDADSTGLLLLTNDGDLTYRLTHPKFEHEKEYLVRIEGSLKPAEIKRLENGLRLEDGPTRPAAVRETASEAPFNYSVTIHEGRKRQVRRMFAALGHQVISLRRVRIGGLMLGDLKEGAARRLSAAEIASLFSNTA